MSENRVWELSTEYFDIECVSEEVIFSDFVRDNPTIEIAIELGSANVVRLVAFVRLKSGIEIGRASIDALEDLERGEPFDFLRLDRSALNKVVMFAIADAIGCLEPVDDKLTAEARRLQSALKEITLI